MYYNSNKVNNDYYNSYKKEISKLQDERKIVERKKVINSIFIFLILSLLLLVAFYFYKYYHTKVDSLTSHFNKKELFLKEQKVKNGMQIIIIQKGDTLSKIAQRAYGDYTDYKKIFTANPEIIQNPNQI